MGEMLLKIKKDLVSASLGRLPQQESSLSKLLALSSLMQADSEGSAEALGEAVGPISS